MTTNYLQAKSSIEALLDTGYVVLLLEITPEESLIFIIDKFEPPKTSGIDAIDFGEFVGYEITEFLKIHQVAYIDKSEFLHKFKSMIVNSKQIRGNFSRNYKWLKMSK
jgi:hypothetical protein